MKKLSLLQKSVGKTKFSMYFQYFQCQNTMLIINCKAFLGSVSLLLNIDNWMMFNFSDKRKADAQFMRFLA